MTAAPGERRTLIVTRGLPGSGKTTAALAWVAQDPTGRARVGTDGIVAMIRPPMPYTQIEAVGLGLQADRVEQAAVHGAIAGLLAAGVDVVCDDVNLLPRHLHALHQLADRCGADVEVWDLTHVDVATCIERDAQRGRDGGHTAGADQIRAKHRIWLAHQAADRCGLVGAR
ncbi:AAA family ATPase [Actinoplanes sp. G11-F43]|uniref:AAA family ATPase n=1 Tax=Actinoplanes sp. G11-F43 TaxID=3424130 RepID=UPI003D34BBDA